MVLDFDSFTRMGFLVDRMSPAETCGGVGGGIKHGHRVQDQKSRKVEEEDRKTTDLSVMAT